MIQIKEANRNELIEIQTLARVIWPVVYREMISLQQIEYMLDWMYSLSALDKQVEEGAIFLLAHLNEKNIGFASYGPAREDRFKLHKLYVHPESHGKGIGKALMEEVFLALQKKGVKQLELQVNKQNKAVGFYQSQGFVIESEKVFDIGHGYVMDDYIMVKDLAFSKVPIEGQ